MVAWEMALTVFSLGWRRNWKLRLTPSPASMSPVSQPLPTTVA